MARQNRKSQVCTCKGRHQSAATEKPGAGKQSSSARTDTKPGNGGELHQAAVGRAPRPHDQSGPRPFPTIKTRSRRTPAVRCCWKISSFAKRSLTSTTSAFLSGSSMPAARVLHGYFELTSSLSALHQPLHSDRGGRDKTPLFNPVLNGFRAAPARWIRRRDVARLRRQVLYQAGQLGPGVGNNVPVFFIQGRHQVPRPDPCRKMEPDRGSPRSATAQLHLLGLHPP